jgi:hypothetical protein
MKIFNLENPIRNSIFIYIIFIIIFIVFFQNKKDIQDKKYILPVVVITISIIIYYIFKLLQFYFT